MKAGFRIKLVQRAINLYTAAHCDHRYQPVIRVTPPKAAAAPTMAYRPGVILQNCFDSHMFSKKGLSWFALKITRYQKNL